MFAAQDMSHQASGVVLRRDGPKPVARHRHHDAAAGSVGPAGPHGPVSCERLIGAVLVIDPLHRGDRVSHTRHQLAASMQAAAKCSNYGAHLGDEDQHVCTCVQLGAWSWLHQGRHLKGPVCSRLCHSQLGHPDCAGQGCVDAWV